MSKVNIVIFELHDTPEYAFFCEEVLPRFVKEDYVNIGEEGFSPLEIKTPISTLIQRLAVRKASVEAQLKSSHLDILQKQHLWYLNETDKYAQRILSAYQKHSEIKFHAIDFESSISKNKAVAYQAVQFMYDRHDLFGSVMPWRDNSMADNLEYIRSENKSESLIARMGIFHHGVQKFLLSKAGEKAAESYRFFYLYNSGNPSDRGEVYVKQGFFSEQFPLGLVQIDCKGLGGKELYKKMRQALVAPNTVTLPFAQWPSSSQLEAEVKKSYPAIQILCRGGIIKNAIIKYYKTQDNKELLDTNKIFNICLRVLFASKKQISLPTFDSISIDLMKNQDLLAELKISKSKQVIDLYQAVINHILPEIVKELKREGLAELTIHDIQPMPSQSPEILGFRLVRKSQDSVATSALRCCGLFTVTLLTAATLTAATSYIMNQRASY